MTTNIEFDAVSNSWDEHSSAAENHNATGVQVAQATTGQAASEPVPVDVGSGAPAQGAANAPAANQPAGNAPAANAPAANAAQGNAPAGNAPAANAAATNVPHEYHAEAGNVVKLPANVSIDNIKVDGHNLVLVQPDGSEIVIKDGALNVPTFIIGDVEVPRVALIAALEASHVDVAFGADGSISAGGNGSPSSAGGNFEHPAGDIGNGFGLTALLPPTDLAFGQPEHRELFPGLVRENSIPTIIDLTPSVDGGDTTVNEKGLETAGATGSGEAGTPPGVDNDTSEHNTGTFTINSPDGIGSLTINNQMISAAALANSGSAPIDITTPLGNTLIINGYDAATGQVSYTYTLLHAETHPAGSDPLFDDITITVTDGNGDISLPGTLSVQIVDDVPTAHDDIGNVPAGSQAPLTGDVFVNDVFGADGKDAGGGVVGVAKGMTNIDLDDTSTLNVGVHGTYGTLTLHADGSYSYVRDAGSPGGVQDVFTYTIKDGDGDLAHTTLTISIGDGTPTIDTIPATGGAATTVYEAGLGTRPGEPAGSHTGEAAYPTTVSGAVDISSPDGVSAVSLQGVTIASTNALSPTTVFSNSTGTLTAWYEATSATAGHIHYTYTLLDNTGDTNNTSVSVPVGVTDNDGDPASGGNLVITIVDDAPLAKADTDSVGTGSATDGNVITGTGTTSGAAGVDIQGADAASVSHIQSNNVGGAGLDVSGSTIIAGQYGTLTIDASGQYSYARNPGSAGGVNDVFTYTLKDGDTDTSTATLTIHIDDSTPTYTLPTAGDGVTTVYEAGLPARNGTEPEGSHIGPTNTTASGVIAVSSVDGVASVSLNNTAITGTSAATATTVLSNSTGTLTAWYDAATSQIHYTYTLLDNTGDTNNTSVSVPVGVTDNDGDPASGGNLVITIVDDAPLAKADTDSVGTGSATDGNVITGTGTTSGAAGVDIQGADAASVSHIQSNNVGGAGLDVSGSTIIAGQYGTLTIDASGQYSYARNPGSAGGVNDVFTYTLKDGDTDTSTATLTIHIDDSTPTYTLPTAGDGVTTVYEAGLPARNGTEPEGSHIGPTNTTASGVIAVSSVDGVASVSLNNTAITGTSAATATTVLSNSTGTLTAWYDAATSQIHYTYTLLDNTGDTNNTSVSVPVGVTDNDGDPASGGNLVITIVDDAPLAKADTDSVGTGSATDGNVITGTGTTSGAAGVDIQGADAASVSHIQSNNVGGAGLDVSGSTIIAGQYGTLTIDASGQYSYARNPGSAGGVNDVFTYTLKDGDTDTSTATLTIHIDDSTPTYTLPTAGDGVTTVYEAGLPARNGTEPEGSHIGPTNTTASGVIAVSSVDGVASVSLNNTAITGTSAATATTVLSNSTGTLTAWYDAATSQIHYTYTLLDNTGDTNNTSVSVPVGVTDNDGDPASGGNLVITIVDDAPLAKADTDSVGTGSATDGNVITGTGTTSGAAGVDIQGADAASVSHIQSNNVGGAGLDVSGSTIIAGQYGTLTIDASGQYSYARNPGSAGGVNDVFTYTLKDGDTDTSTATLTIHIDDSTPTYTLPTAGDGVTTVYEAGLPARNGTEPEGSHIGPTNTTASGVIAVSSVDGVASVSLNNTAITGTSAATATTVLSNSTGTLTAWYDAATSQIHYTYTLLDNTGDTNNTSVSVPVGVTDNDGDPASGGNLVITIVDDAPLAKADTDSVGTGSATDGNVITGTGTTSGAAGVDIQGADAASVSHIQSNNVGGAGLDVSGSTIIAGQYGTLTIDASGQYSYARNPGSAGGVNDVFTYTLKDGDTDTSTATLTIHIDDSTPTYTLPTAGDGVTTVYEAGLPARNGTEPEGSHIGPTNTTASGVIAVSSVDGVASVSLNNTAITGTSAATATTVLSNSTGTLTAWYDAATSQIHYTYTLLDNTGDTNNTSVSVPVGVTDNDGDPASGGNLVITIVDDAPLAKADTDSVGTGSATDGNVITGTGTTSGAAGVDIQGADAASVSHIQSNNVGGAGLDVSGSTIIAGQYGTLTIDASGQYSYARNPGSAGGVNDVFTYTLKDGDTDTSTATLTIHIDDSTPTYTLPTAGDGVTTVYEAGLPARNGTEPEGSHIGPTNTTASGVIAVSSVDGVASVSLNNTAITGTSAATATTVLSNSTGTLTAWYDAATSQIHYTYTLLDNTGDTNNTSVSVPVGVTDNDGDPASGGNLVITIVDDAPLAKADTDAAQSGETVTGNVETGASTHGTGVADTAGADGIASITWTNAVTNAGVTTVTGNHGVLTVQADGSYSYKAFANTSGTDVFAYTIKDGDGDTSPSTLTINVTNGQPQPVAATVQVDEAALDTSAVGDLAASTVTGSNPSSTNETKTGTLTLGDPNSPHVTNIVGAVTQSAVGGSAVTVQGNYGLLQIDQNGNYTYTLTKPYTTNPASDNGAQVEAGKDVFTYTVTDALGNTSTSTITVDIKDDVPAAVSPDYAVLSNSAGGAVAFALDADHNVSNNYGADGAGTVRFAASLDGTDSGLTSGGVHILYDVSQDGHTLIGTANGATVFTVTLNPANSTYSVDMDGSVDSLSQITFTNGSYAFYGGNSPWAGFVPAGQQNNPVNDDSRDVLFTPLGDGTTINGNANSFGVGGGFAGQNIGSGEGIRVDFVQDLTGSSATAGGQIFDSHYVANGTNFTFGDGTVNSVLKITAFDDNATTGTDNNHVVGDGHYDSVSSVVITYNGQSQTVDFVDTAAHAYSIGGRTYTVQFVDADPSAAVHYAAQVTGILDTSVSIATFTADGYNSLELSNISPLKGNGQPDTGTDFAITGFGSAVQSSDPVSFSLPVQIVDGDGDTAASSIGITLTGTTTQNHSADLAGNTYTATSLLPNIIGSNFDDTLNGDGSANALYGGAGNDTINGNGGNDTLIGGAGNDILSGGAGNDLLIGGAGADTLTGGTGADTFKLDHLELNIKDIIADYNKAEGDQIDLTALFDKADNVALSNYVQYNGTTHTLSVDTSGSGNPANFVDVAQLTNSPAAGTINILYDDANHHQQSTTI